MELQEQVDAGHLRHFVVGDQKVIAINLEYVPGGSAISDGVHFVAGANQHLGVETADVRIVFGYENALTGI
jgi:hypothetical protein